jgi:hypothetical protein
VQRITKTLAGELSYEAVHFPVDNQGRSLIALAVANTGGTGVTLTSNRSGLGCDLNSATDTTVPEETFSLPDLDGLGGGSIDIGGGLNFGGGGSVDIPVTPNPNDGLDGGTGSLPSQTITGPSGVTKPVAGATLQPTTTTCGTSGVKTVKWFDSTQEVATVDYKNPASPKVTYSMPVGANRPPIDAATGALQIPSENVGNKYTSKVECNNGTITTEATTVIANQPGQSGFVDPGQRFAISYLAYYNTGRFGGTTLASYKTPPWYYVNTFSDQIVFLGFTSPDQFVPVRLNWIPTSGLVDLVITKA